MIKRPFSNYLDTLPEQFGGEHITDTELKQIGYPIDPDLFYENGNGLIPVKNKLQKLYDLRELIGYTRIYSIPSEGFISKKPIRAAEILDCEFVQDENLLWPKIKTVRVAAAFLPPNDPTRGSGQVVFICPFCGDIHYHGASGKKFGDGDGDRVPHCICENPAYFRINAQKYLTWLNPYWHFYLEETDDFTRAGDFPKYFARQLVNRHKG